MGGYATLEDYQTMTGDVDSPDEKVNMLLGQQSAKLRALCGISPTTLLSDDAKTLACSLVIDATKKALMPPMVDVMGELTGVSQASFSANGFQSSYSVANPSGSAYFDKSTLAAFKKLIKQTQRIGTILPSYGRFS